MQGAYREAALAWLWTLVGTNETRAAGGDKGVLKDEFTLLSAPLAVMPPTCCCRPDLAALPAS